MDEQIELTPEELQYVQEQVALGVQQELARREQEKDRPAFDRFAEQFSLAKTAEGIGESALGLVKAPFQIAGAAASEAIDNPLRTVATMGASAIADPLIRTFAAHAKDVGGQQAAVDVLKGVAGIVPGGRTLGEVAQHIGYTGELPSAEQVGKWAQAEVGPAVVAGGVGGLLKGGTRLVDAMVGPSSQRVAKTIVDSGAFDQGMAGAAQSLWGRTATGLSKTDDAVLAAEDFAKLKDPLNGKPIIAQAERSKEGLDYIREALQRAKSAAGSGREQLLTKLDEAAFVTNQALPDGSPALGTLSYADINTDLLLKRLALQPEEVQLAIKESMDELLGDLKAGSGIKRGDIPSGVSFSEAQNTIQKIDNRIASLKGYDANQKAAFFQQKTRSPDADLEALRILRGSLQEALKKKIDDLAESGAIDPMSRRLYEDYNKQYAAASVYDPLLRRISQEKVGALQQPNPSSLNTAVQGVRGTITSAIANTPGKLALEGLQMEANAVQRMRDLVHFQSGQQLDLVPRTWELARQSMRANAILAQAAMQMGLPFQTPAQKKQAHLALSQMRPELFQPSKTGYASEVNGKILDPFEQDMYLQERFESFEEDATKRADVIGPFLSQKKVTDDFQINTPINPLQEIEAVELFPQADGSFSREAPTPSVDASLLNFLAGQQASRSSY